ncbi:hypothetical protein [Paracoccus sp. PAMC 22219]|uniref:hypothetical protein n=1 Tax=Paracoccus sp. PAMC 22219 TaxID=1569209 RepID=UPI0012E01022|nr:hypothetical protein [Paracoccus sp. PAMC 22219]
MSGDNQSLRDYERDRKVNSYLRIEKKARFASVIEIAVFFTPISLSTPIIYNYFYVRYRYLSGETENLIEFPISILVLLSAAFMQIVYYTLTSRTIIVDIIFSIIMRRKFPLSDGSGMGSSRDFDPSVNFRRYVERSKETLKSAQRRPNTLMLIGAAVALSGLAFFMATLPINNYIDGSRLIELHSKGLISDAELNIQRDYLGELISLIPRLLMVIFIQLLAGFFLRQYRTSMEELRYYESVLRSRENQMLIYCMVKDLDIDQKKVVIDSLNGKDGKDMMKLQQGESTITVETYRLEENEFKGPIDKLIDAFANIKK